MQWVMAAILICGVTTFTSCTNEDNPVTPDLNVAEKIIGKWIMTDKNGQPITTSGRLVYTFVSTTKALVSVSLNSRPEVGSHWSGQLEADVSISGNNVTFSMNLDEHTTSVHNYTITAIDANEFTASDIVTITIDGNVILTAENVFRFTKVTADFSQAKTRLTSTSLTAHCSAPAGWTTSRRTASGGKSPSTVTR